jgi:hypothetical protein
MGILRGRLHYYIFGAVGFAKGDGSGTVGKSIALGPFRSDNEAHTAANNINDWVNDYEVCSYRTSQLAVAKSCWKAEKAQKTGNLGISLQPIRSGNSKKTSRFEQIKESRGIE